MDEFFQWFLFITYVLMLISMIAAWISDERYYRKRQREIDEWYVKAMKELEE